MTPNWLDFGIALLIVVAGFRGYGRGLVREGMALFGLVGGMILAAQRQKAGAELLAPFVGPGALAEGLAYLAIVLACLGGATLLTLIIRRIFRILLVGWVDHAAGGVFGAAQGAILAALILFGMLKFKLFGIDKAIADSDLATAVLGALPAAIALLPGELQAIARLLTAPK